MQLHLGFDDFPKDVATVVTVGSFDGVHLGHRVLLDRVKQLATRLNARSVVVTFEPHPRIAMGRAEGMGLLTTVEERAALLAEAGIDYVVVARFDEKFRSQSFEDFVRESLVGKLSMRGLVVGYNHRLGRGNEGRYETLLPIAEECAFELERVEQYLATGAKVSSTVVRAELDRGNVYRAAELLGHPYIIYGIANEGKVELTNEHKLLPPNGSYRATISRGTDSPALETMLHVDGASLTLSERIDGELTIALHDRA